MRAFFSWWFVNAVSLFVVAALLPGVRLSDGLLPLVGVALLIGLINALLRPILYIMSCGCILLTLGLIVPILNALLLLFADRLAGDLFSVDSLLWAVVAALLMGFINSVLQNLIEPDKKDEQPYVIFKR